MSEPKADPSVSTEPSDNVSNIVIPKEGPHGLDYKSFYAISDGLFADLKEIERHCPCGARPESPNTHPHVGGCPVARALRRFNGPQPATASGQSLLTGESWHIVDHGDSVGVTVQDQDDREIFVVGCWNPDPSEHSRLDYCRAKKICTEHNKSHANYVTRASGQPVTEIEQLISNLVCDYDLGERPLADIRAIITRACAEKDRILDLVKKEAAEEFEGHERQLDEKDKEIAELHDSFDDLKVLADGYIKEIAELGKRLAAVNKFIYEHQIPLDQ